MRKKLIEVALPLEAINKESAREKSIRHGHPSTLHLWWARRPLAACRAVLFASLIDDPDQEGVPPALLERIDRLPLPDDRGPEWPSLPLGEQRRKRLFGFIERLVKWENSTNEEILQTARELIHAATDGNPPPVLDPFCGGGSIPLEAQRLGLEAHASDLNPVAVLITKALIEIPPKFANLPPVNPVDRARGVGAAWKGAAGLAADVRYYGKWMRDEAEKRIGHLYPKGPNGETIVAWIWARTVTCPNPACSAQMPLVSSFWLSTKRSGKAWTEPVVNRARKTVHFEVNTGVGEPPTGTVNRRGATCIVCGASVPFSHVRTQGKIGRMGTQLMAIVAAGNRGRVYLPATDKHVAVASDARPSWFPDTELPEKHRSITAQLYGLDQHGKLFTPRQLVALTAFSNLLSEARELIRRDAVTADLPEDSKALNDGGIGPLAYADAVITYLAFALSKVADRGSSICTWFTERDSTRSTFARQSIAMSWDFAELNTLLKGTGSFAGAVHWTAESLDGVPHSHVGPGKARQLDATSTVNSINQALICTDPPYYDNIGYAELSDFFYVWLRRSLNTAYPSLFDTLLTPKAEELVAGSYRFGGDKWKAKLFFEEGLGKAFVRMCQVQHPGYPLIAFYAFKQAESENEGNGTSTLVSSGWETMLEGLIRASFSITGTWPMRSELSNRPVASGTNALGSSIVLVCRPRPASAPLTTLGDFRATLKRELPGALIKLQHGNVAPVDLAQAAIGPGMAVFSRYASVLKADSSQVSVRMALQVINEELDAYLAAQEGELDADTRFCVAWFEQFGVREALFGAADVLARAKNTSVQGLVEAGVLWARAGKVRLLRRDELPEDWDPRRDRRVSVWECVQHLIRRLDTGGEQGAAALLAALGGDQAEAVRALAYRLYTVCERKGWAEEGLTYNGLVVSWPRILELASTAEPAQPDLFG